MWGAAAPKFPCAAGKTMRVQRMESCPAPGKSWSQACCCPSDFFKQLARPFGKYGSRAFRSNSPIPSTHKPTLFAEIATQLTLWPCSLTCGSELCALTSLPWLFASLPFNRKCLSTKKEIRMTFLLHFIPLTHAQKIIIAMGGERQRDVGAPEFPLPWCVDTSFQPTLSINGFDTTEQWM